MELHPRGRALLRELCAPAAASITRGIRVPRARRPVPCFGLAKIPVVAFGATFYPILQDKAGERGDAWLQTPALGTGRTWWYPATTAASDAGPPQPCPVPVPSPVASARPQDHTETLIPIASQRGGESIPAAGDAETRQGNPCSRGVPSALPHPRAAVSSGSDSLFAYSYP